MWRLQGLVGRVVGRCHGSAPLRLSQSHHVEDEVLNTSTVLSSSLHQADSGSQREEDERKWKKKTSSYCYTGLLRSTALDAVGWGAAAMLFMQLCRRIHSQFSVSDHGPSTGPGARTYKKAGHLQRCGYRVLLDILSRRNILPENMSVKCLMANPEDECGSSDSDHNPETVENLPFFHSVGVSQSNDSTLSDETSSENSSPKGAAGAGCPHEDSKNCLLSEEELKNAEDNLQRVTDSSIPVILNIIGIESARKGNVHTAFSCFLVAAEHGYSKAQFNVGVCYETGRGVSKDLDMAANFYKQAAALGHSQAQYRYAKHLLRCRGQQNTESTQAGINLLEKAAASGVREAQAYLGVLFTQEPLQDWQKAVHYLQMAAENGDSVSQLYLGHCYRQGLGVVPNLQTAVQLYQSAAEGGNSEAKRLFSAYKAKVSSVPEDTLLRPARSFPCFSSADPLQLPLHLGSPDAAQDIASSPFASQALRHSWSTGCFRPLVPPRSLPGLPESQEIGGPLLPLNNASHGWTIGVG